MIKTYNIHNRILTEVLGQQISETIEINYRNELSGSVIGYKESGIITNYNIPDVSFLDTTNSFKSKYGMLCSRLDYSGYDPIKDAEYLKYKALSIGFHELGHIFYNHTCSYTNKPYYIKEFEAEIYALKHLRMIKTPKKIYKRLLKESREYCGSCYFDEEKNDYYSIKFNLKNFDKRYANFIDQKTLDTIVYCISCYQSNKPYNESDFDKDGKNSDGRYSFETDNYLAYDKYMKQHRENRKRKKNITIDKNLYKEHILLRIFKKYIILEDKVSSYLYKLVFSKFG